MGYRENVIANWKHIGVNAVMMMGAVAGLVAAARGAPFGMRIVMLTTICSLGYTSLVRAQGGGLLRPLDERELAVAGEGLGLGAMVSCGLASIWCMMIGITDKGIWYPDAAVEWMATGLFLIGLMAQVRNFAVALTTPPYAAELLDEG